MSDIKEYPAITEYGYIKDGNVYLKGYGGFQDREIGVVRDSDEVSLQYFLDRFERVKEKLQAVEDAIHTNDNKGSYLMKLIHMRTYLASYNGLGDFTALYRKIEELEDFIGEYIKVNREKNYNIKQALLDEAEQVKNSTNWKFSSIKMKELKQKWIKTGSAYKDHEDDLSKGFNDAIETFFERRKSYYDEQAQILKERLDQYKDLIDELKRINRDPRIQDHIPRVKAIQRDWKNVGRVHKSKFGKFAMEFKREIEKFFYGLKLQKAASEKTGIELKRDLYKDSELMLETGVPFDIQRVKQIQNQWKNVGKLPEAEDRELNLKFRILCNEIFETHFLEKTARETIPYYHKKTLEDQMRSKLKMLDESIQKDEDELYDFSVQHGISPDADPRTITDPDILRDRNNIINKLKTKQRIHRKIKEKLAITSSR